MSAKPRTGKSTPDTTRDDAPPDINAYEIAIPEGFVGAYPAADTVAEALRLAEQAPAHDADTTADRECPRCSSVRITRKTGYDSQQEHTTQWVCTHCRTHFDDPEHPETGAIEFSDGQVQLGRWADE
jgi:DNA-directed RNA polymerase subunit RPC12/RpoP